MPSATKSKPAPLCYSYARFSSKHQGKGDSLTRQNEARDAWLARKGLALDESLVMVDAGVSGFKGAHRENPDRNALASFLELVKRGSVPRGSYLIVESLDRLSREHIRPALTLLLNLIDAGVRVVQLLPVENVYDEDVEPMNLMMAIMELSRGHSESAVKSDRVGKAWKRLKEKAAATGVPITKEVPAWLVVADGKFAVRPGAADTVRLIFRLATEGKGFNGIMRHLAEHEVPPLGDCPKWARATVAKMLASRKPVGEYQPMKWGGGKNRQPDGPPIPNYYPALITEDEWAAARFALEGRKAKRGPNGKHLFLWSGLLKDARDGGPIYRDDKGAKGGGAKLATATGMQGERPYVSFPLAAFETEILKRLREIDPREIVPGAGGAVELKGLQIRRASVESRIERIQSQMETGDEDVGPLVAVLRKLQGELDDLGDKIAATEAESATPLAHAWADCSSLIDAVCGEKGDEARERLRSALRRTVIGMWCLFVGKGRTRLAAVRVQFRGEAHRDYLIVHKAAHAPSGTAAETLSASFREVGDVGEIELRNPADAKKVETFLSEVDVPELVAAVEAKNAVAEKAPAKMRGRK